jgi:hypothetical protein
MEYSFRPDYRSDNLRLVIEFDGERYYTKAKCVLDDEIKDRIYTSSGYKVIRIPGFIQFNSLVINKIFDRNIVFDQKFPHGFISKEVCLPADFCDLGIDRFEKDINERFYFCKKEIIQSLKNKVQYFKNPLLVLPKRLMYLLDD